MNRRQLGVVVLILLLSYSLTFAQKINYPKTKTGNVVDFYHGQKVFDPYRWLEQKDSPEVQAWADSQNSLLHSYLDSISFRPAIKERMTELFDYPLNILPARRDNRYFYFQRPTGKSQGILFMKNSIDSEPSVVVDPNTINSIGTTALTAWEVSHDARYLAYALSIGGSDWQEIHLRDIDASYDFDEVLKGCKFVNLAWAPNDSGIYYNRWPEPGTVSSDDEYKQNKLYWHKIGTPQSADSVVFEVPENEEVNLSHYVTRDQKYLMLEVRNRFDYKVDLYYLEFGKSNNFQRVMHDEHSYYTYIDNIGSTFFFHTGLKAPGGKVISIDLEKPDQKYWREIIPAGDIVIDYVALVNNCFVIAYMESAYHKLKILDLKGQFIKGLELPTMGMISGLDGSREDSILYMGFESFVYPPTTYIYNFYNGEFKQFNKSSFDFDFSSYVTIQTFYKSFGGVKIPMFITCNKNLPMDGTAPALLYGYGGFGRSEVPHFSPSLCFWLENGGIYAVANIRGGGEYGHNWHWAGWGPYKQTSFDDFANAAKWLIKNQITNASKLAIIGGSNGGLLTAVSVEQNPKLFGAVVCKVPVTDMLRFPEFTVGKIWINEYGDPVNDASAFKLLQSYSPVHNVSHWNKYPPILVTAGENDDRVAPLHAYKFIAALQAEDDGENPKLLRVESDAGHGQGKPFDKLIEEQTDVYTFIFKSLGITPNGFGNKVGKN